MAAGPDVRRPRVILHGHSIRHTTPEPCDLSPPLTAVTPARARANSNRGKKHEGLHQGSTQTRVRVAGTGVSAGSHSGICRRWTGRAGVAEDDRCQSPPPFPGTATSIPTEWPRSSTRPAICARARPSTQTTCPAAAREAWALPRRWSCSSAVRAGIRSGARLVLRGRRQQHGQSAALNACSSGGTRIRSRRSSPACRRKPRGRDLTAVHLPCVFTATPCTSKRAPRRSLAAPMNARAG